MKLDLAFVCALALVGCNRSPNAQKVWGSMHDAACAGDATKFFAHVAEDRFVDDAAKNAWQKDINANGRSSEVCGWSFVAMEKNGDKDRVEVRSKRGDKQYLFFEKVGGDLKVVDFQVIGGTAPTPSASQVAQSQPPPALTEAVRADTARLGERVTFPDCEWVVMEARNAGKLLKSNSEFNEEVRKSEGRFIQVHYRLTNKGSKEEMILDRPKLVDAKGREFGPIDMESFYVPAKTKTIGLDTLQPDLPKEYWTVIEVPADATGLRFKVHGFTLVGPSKMVEINL